MTSRNLQVLFLVLIVFILPMAVFFTYLNRPVNQSNVVFQTPSTQTYSEASVNSVGKYPLHRDIRATMFWVGEKASDANDYIPNKSSAWDINWMENFGGIDTPYSRKGYHPEDFIPNENPFYIALPYNDFDDSGRKENAKNIPWYFEGAGEKYSFVKNRWVRLLYKGNVCYGQWEDVGPFEEDDFAYVFEGQPPKEKRAGIDLSPALTTCLKMATNDNIHWQFVEEEQVPHGPWKEKITTGGVTW